MSNIVPFDKNCSPAISLEQSRAIDQFSHDLSEALRRACENNVISGMIVAELWRALHAFTNAQYEGEE